MTGITRTAGHQYSYAGKGPFPGVTSIVALQDSLGGSDGLLTWAVNLALDQVEREVPSLDWAATRQRALAAKNAPRDLGSAIHAAVDRFNRGLPLGVTNETAPYVAQWGAFVHDRVDTILGSERFVINTDIGFGGAYDSLVDIDGETGPLDVKSGKEKPSQRLQLTGLSMGELHGEPGLEPEPMPVLDGVGFILLLRPDGYELIRHEITQSDRDHFKRLVDMYHHVREWSASFAPSKGAPAGLQEEATA